MQTSQYHRLKESYRSVIDRVAQAAAKADRRPQDIITVAVTKSASTDQIHTIVELGHLDFGESRPQQLAQRVGQIQEFLGRRQTLSKTDSVDAAPAPAQIRWHMIGHLQRNKVKPILPLVKLVHSVDSLRLVEELQAQACKVDCVLDVLLQVNASGEATKQGLALPAVPHLAEQIQGMFNLRLRGLMTMAPLSENPEDARTCFGRTHELFDEIQSEGRFGKTFNVLSMGMSNDFEVAIEHGANIVRVGRAIFGPGEEIEQNADVASE